MASLGRLVGKNTGLKTIWLNLQGCVWRPLFWFGFFSGVCSTASYGVYRGILSARVLGLPGAVSAVRTKL